MKRKTISGQALVEYVLITGLIAVSVFSIIKLFSRWVELTFQEQAISLGYEIPSERQLISANKSLLKARMDAISLKNKLGSYYDRKN